MIGKVRAEGETYSLKSDGKELVGIAQDVPVSANKVYALSFRARAGRGRRDMLNGILGAGGHVEFCQMTDFMLSASAEPATCLYLPPNEDHKVTIALITASRAGIQVSDVRFAEVGSLPLYGSGYEIKTRAGDLTLLENKNVLPRAYFVASLCGVKSYAEARSELWQMSKPLDLATTALVEGLPSSAPVSVDAGSVKDVRYLPNAVDLRVSCDGRCFLVLSDQYFPGWHVFVDGRETKLYRTDAVVRGCFVPAGTHEVHYIYRPLGLNWALAVAALSAAFAVSLVYIDRRGSGMR